MKNEKPDHYTFRFSSGMPSLETYISIAELMLKSSHGTLVYINPPDGHSPWDSEYYLKTRPERLPLEVQAEETQDASVYLPRQHALDFAESKGLQTEQATRVMNAIGRAQLEGKLPDGIQVYDFSGNELQTDSHSVAAMGQLASLGAIRLLEIPGIGKNSIPFLEAYGATYENKKPGDEAI